MMKELEDSVHQCGAMLIFLYPYSSELNPTESFFGQMKRQIQKHTNLLFLLYPDIVLEVAMYGRTQNSLGLCSHCGCDNRELDKEFFEGFLSGGES